MTAPEGHVSNKSHIYQANELVTVIEASTPSELKSIRDLFLEYVTWLNLDISFQNFSDEFLNLPGKYGPPKGSLLLAKDSSEGTVLGCVALRPIELLPMFVDNERNHRSICEIKRLYVYPKARGRGVAKILLKQVISIAKEKKYEMILLDTLAHMEQARRLYISEGFEETSPYYENPLENVIYYGKSI